jgi:hypothetical protein
MLNHPGITSQKVWWIKYKQFEEVEIFLEFPQL